MPLYLLKIKADLENIQSLTPIPGNMWKLDIQSGTGDETRKDVTISTEDVIPLDGSRGEANFVIKWPYTNDQAYMKFVTHKQVKPSYQEADSGKFVPILAIECRSIEPTAWHPNLDFVAESTGGGIFDKVDLSDRDWAEFDEENDLSVSITNVEYKFELTK